MDLEEKLAAIKKLIEESASPRREPAGVTNITVHGDHAIVARRVVIQHGLAGALVDGKYPLMGE